MLSVVKCKTSKWIKRILSKNACFDYLTGESLTWRLIANALKDLGETEIPAVQCNNLQVSSYALLQDSVFRTA